MKNLDDLKLIIPQYKLLKFDSSFNRGSYFEIPEIEAKR